MECSGLEEVTTGNSTVDSNERLGALADLFSYQCNLTSHGLYTRIQFMLDCYVYPLILCPAS